MCPGVTACVCPCDLVLEELANLRLQIRQEQRQHEARTLEWTNAEDNAASKVAAAEAQIAKKWQ